jgi:hypothetical protein
MPSKGPKTKSGMGTAIRRGSVDPRRRGSAKHLVTPKSVVLEPSSDFLDPKELRARPLSGGPLDADRTRIVKGFYQALPDKRVLYLDVMKEVSYDATLNRRLNIFKIPVPSARIYVIDRVEFYAWPVGGGAPLGPGIIEGAVQFGFLVGKTAPVDITTQRIQAGLQPNDGAYFPFLNDRVGATQVTFSLSATTGQPLEAYYLNRVASPVALRTVGARMRGWMGDVSILEEILEQQR